MSEYDQLVEQLAKICTCTPLSDRPCDGLLAGGLCDDLHFDGRQNELDDEPLSEPDEKL